MRLLLVALLAWPLAAQAQSGRLWPPGSPAQRAVAPDCATCWVQEVEVAAAAAAPVAAPANPTCYGQPSIDFFRTALAIVAPRTAPAVSGDLAEAIRALDPPMFEALREGSAADFRTLLRLPAGRVPYANCMPLAALLPAGGVPVAVRLGVVRGGVAQACDPVSGACGGGGRFVQPPEAFAARERVGVGAVFMAEPGAAGDVVRLTVAYRMPDDAKPVPLR
ncbi:MAG: hypothetical protein BGP12_17835 [Rhodospirillales bacterium 70-18]|nr:hypothetical protein [Rhodospirillales bacterium]OJY65711.1 MAG: hypothetical protein BGP12_17835 [Rhodospirillales bacterium 70-18]